MNWLSSIRSRLLVWLIPPLVAVAGLVALETLSTSRKTAETLHDRTLLAVMLAISENVLATNGDVLSESVLEVISDNLGDQFFYHVTWPENAFVTGYAGVPKLPEGQELKGGKPLFFDGSYKNDPVRVVAMRQLLTERELNGWITIVAWQKIRQRQALAFDLTARSLMRLAVMVLSAALIVWIAVAFGLRPLAGLKEAIEKRSPDDLTPIKRFLPNEVRGIVSSMNDLFRRLADAQTARERFIGDAAHQLKNPIAALKTQAEAAKSAPGSAELRGRVGEVVTTADSMGRLVDQLLMNARANTQIDRTELVELGPLLEEIAAEAAPAALAKQQDYGLQACASALLVRGNRLLLGEAVSNLVDNAIRHTGEGAKITIGLRVSGNGEDAMIYVSDSEPNLAASDLERVSAPFATGDTSQAGSGLGLSIASDIAKLHDGGLSIGPAPDEGGKEIALRLPLADRAGGPGPRD
ncbi:MAG: sensor histidine kinase N-terminal domain-containing protein [Pseudomonadota bacterium]